MEKQKNMAEAVSEPLFDNNELFFIGLYIGRRVPRYQLGHDFLKNTLCLNDKTAMAYFYNANAFDTPMKPLLESIPKKLLDSDEGIDRVLWLRDRVMKDRIRYLFPHSLDKEGKKSLSDIFIGEQSIQKRIHELNDQIDNQPKYIRWITHPLHLRDTPKFPETPSWSEVIRKLYIKEIEGYVDSVDWFIRSDNGSSWTALTDESKFGHCTVEYLEDPKDEVHYSSEFFLNDDLDRGYETGCFAKRADIIKAQILCKGYKYEIIFDDARAEFIETTEMKTQCYKDITKEYNKLEKQDVIMSNEASFKYHRKRKSISDKIHHKYGLDPDYYNDNPEFTVTVTKV